MKMRLFKPLIGSIIFCLMGVLSTLTSAQESKPLFSSEEVITLRITGPFKSLIQKAPTSTEPYQAVLTLNGAVVEEHAIMLSARGNSRRDRNICDFPPLRVEFTSKPEDTSLFDGQKRLKLVTHCQSSSRYQQYYMLEYAAYKLLNVMTPASLQVRMAEIDYIEASSGKTIKSRYGFFIEDTDDAAKRLGIKEIDIGDVSMAQINPEAAARYALFQYMIGNLDWSMHDGIKNEDCCHNTKLIGERTEPLSNLIPIPYDFDYSGLADTPYAVPPEGVRVRNVRTRRYRGFCQHNNVVRTMATEFLDQQDELLAVFESVPGLEDRKRNSAERYLDGFFQNIANDEKLNSRLLSNCRS